jgi:Zn-dependent membrane protease YugP
MGKQVSPEAEFATAFSVVFCLLGLKLLVGSKPVTTGSVLLLGSISASAASAWTGATGTWAQKQVSSMFQNYSTVEGMLQQALSLTMARMRRGISQDSDVEMDEL